MTDEAVRVGPAVATESYLNMEAILSFIEETRALGTTYYTNIHDIIVM